VQLGDDHVKTLALALLCLCFVPTAFAQHLWIDASQFNQKDICVYIQAAIAALPIVTDTPAVSAGIVIDARNFTPPASGVLSCSVNPFAIFGNPTTVVTLAALGSGSGTAPRMAAHSTIFNLRVGTASTRPVDTTSSSVQSAPNFFGMALGTPITGVQGTLGTLVQMSTGTATSGDFVMFDGSGDTVDSGVSATNPVFGSINQSPSSSFGGTCALSGTGTTCTVTLSHTYTAPICIATEQGSSGSVKAAMCSVSGTTATVTTSSSGSGVVWGVFVFGNPN